MGAFGLFFCSFIVFFRSFEQLFSKIVRSIKLFFSKNLSFFECLFQKFAHSLKSWSFFQIFWKNCLFSFQSLNWFFLRPIKKTIFFSFFFFGRFIKFFVYFPKISFVYKKRCTSLDATRILSLAYKYLGFYQQIIYKYSIQIFRFISTNYLHADRL